MQMNLAHNNMMESHVPMPDNAIIRPDHRFLYKPLEATQYGGCHASVWLPKKDAGRKDGMPVAMFYHGGAWTIGTSTQIPYYQARYLLDRGVVVVSFDYRLLPHANLKDIQEDLLDSYKYIQQGLNRDLLKAGSDVVVDGTRAAAFGLSAGASNTLYLAHQIETYNHECGEAHALPPLRVIIPIDPLVTFDVLCEPKSAFLDAAKADPLLARTIERVDQQECQTSYDMPLEYWSRITNICFDRGEGEIEMDRENARCIWVFKNKSICSYLAGCDQPYPAAAEPLNLVSRTFPPTCIVAASADEMIPPIQSRNLYNRLKELGVDAMRVECEGMNHGEAELSPISPKWPEGNTWWEDALLPSLQFALERMTK